MKIAYFDWFQTLYRRGRGKISDGIYELPFKPSGVVHCFYWPIYLCHSFCRNEWEPWPSLNERMKVGSKMFSKEQDQAFLRAAIEVSRKSRESGNHPFGSVLVNESGQIVLESQNNYTIDRLGHAEANVARMAAVQFEEDYLRGCTMYTSVEPCCMCAGTAYWAGLGAVVFGVTEARLGELTGSHPENLTMDLPCRTVFGAGRRPVEVRGPFPELETEILKVHEGFWT